MPTSVPNGSVWLDTDATSTTVFQQYWRKAMSGAVTTISGNDDYAYTLAYTVGFEDVYLNGVLLVRAVDYTATDGTSVVLTAATISGDYVEIITTATFNAANTYTQAAANTLLDAKQDKTGTVADATTSTAARGIGYMGIPQSAAATTGAYAIVAADAGEHIYTTATRTITIPANASVAFPVGTAISFIAATGATVTIAITTDTLILAGPGTTGSRTLAPFGMATCVKITSTSWIISGNGLT
jgi:hypothetical protein